MAEPVPNTFVREGRIYTINLGSGPVYGERVLKREGREYREWSPARSKLAEYLGSGGRLPLRAGQDLLYLGAGSGTTASHVSDILADGRVPCVESAPIPFFRLKDVSSGRPNMTPILADARHPERYAPAVRRADAVYQDIAQKDQIDMFVRNLELFGADWGLIMLKVRSISHRPASEIVPRELRKLEDYSVEETDISARHPDHRAYLVRR
jgi:fibrillarin-like pre-rRNA processing protein